MPWATLPSQKVSMSETSLENLETFWELVEEILNAVLFVLIRLEALLISFRVDALLFALALIPDVPLIRLSAG